MSVQIHINGESAEEAVKEFSVLANHFKSPTVGVPVSAESTKPVRNRSTAAKPVETEKPVENTVSEDITSDEGTGSMAIDDDFQEDQDDGAAVPVPTVVELRAKASEVGKTAEDKKAIKALLDKYGSKSISEVPEESRTAFLAGLGKI